MIGFASPWILLGLIALPAIWWLLRVMPPSPKLVRFPAIRLLRELAQREETPARTPLWLLLLRTLLAALLIVALAGPVLEPSEAPPGRRPEIIIVDNGWAAAEIWTEIHTALMDEIDRDDRAGLPVILVATAKSASGDPIDAIGPLTAAAARQRAEALQPVPWAADRAAAAQVLSRLDGRSPVLWLSDGVQSAGSDALSSAVAGFASPRVRVPPTTALPRIVAPPESGPNLIVKVRRAVSGQSQPVSLIARGADGRIIGEAKGLFGDRDTTASLTFDLPAEVRNGIARIDLEGSRTVSGTVLVDERWRRRPVAIAIPPGGAETNELLSDVFYLQKALQPFADVKTGDLKTMLESKPAVLILSDAVPVTAADKRAIAPWIASGGLLLRLAGQRLAAADPIAGDPLLPVQLRTGGRSLSGTMAWTEPATLAAFPAETPFSDLDVPKDVAVNQQILAEPSIDLDKKVWARLGDGTPLITADHREKGTVVLIHTNADPLWSNIAISGLFPQMLRRIVSYSAGVSNTPAHGTFDPYRLLDGFGRLQSPSGAATAVSAESFDGTAPSAQHPPGFYGDAESRRALNLTQTLTEIEPLRGLSGIERLGYVASSEISIAPWLLAAALALAAIDTVIALWLGGTLPRLPRPPRRAVAAAAALVAAVVLAGPAYAADPVPPPNPQVDKLAAEGAAQVTLGYIVTGDDSTDRISKAGLVGLTAELVRRTSIDHASSSAVDVERDELSVYPFLYWPISTTAKPMSEQAKGKLNRYLSSGGMILIDTRAGSGGTTPGLGRVIEGIDVPALVTIPATHVLTKTFYLLNEFPGRLPSSDVWVERDQDTHHDGVSGIVVGGSDWAGAWAQNEVGGPMFQLAADGERQRDLAYRFGVNIVMYALTGNYKDDLVHQSFIRDRLGQ